MKKKTKTLNVTPDKTASDQPEALRRVMVLVSEADLQAARAAFAEGRSATVTVHAPVRSALTDAQREKRRAYRQRPEVREHMKAYRVLRNKRLREALAQPQSETTA